MKMAVVLGLFVAMACSPALAQQRPRLAVLTDIGGDPDDQQSLIRLLLYANEFEIEALVASASGTRGELKSAITRPELIRASIDAYEKVLPNLQRHASGWPAADALLDVVKSGNPQREREHIGAGHDTEGSLWLREKIEEGSADQPLNISIWGGQTDLAQALWRVKHDGGEATWSSFVKKFRVYDINDQDGIADWMRTEFPGMTAPNVHGCLKEGDTPSWFFFLPLGQNDPSDPGKAGWGGQFQRQAAGWYGDLPATEQFDPRTTVSQWRAAYQADFSKRMKWCLP